MKRIRRHKPTTDTKIRKGRESWVYKETHDIHAHMYYRQQTVNVQTREYKRWYFVGAVMVAFVDVRKGAKQYIIYMNSRSGNGGTTFYKLSKVERFIREELKREPTNLIGRW